MKDGDCDGCIIFIDELDAIGMKREAGEQSGEREVYRTLCELLNQLDGFESHDMIKVIAATNRPDILDPALLRSGRLDRKIELPMPSEEARAKILKIHSRRMHLSDGVDFEELLEKERKRRKTASKKSKSGEGEGESDDDDKDEEDNNDKTVAAEIEYECIKVSV